MNFDSLVKQLANRINQPHVIRHYLLVVWRTAFKEAEKKQLHIPVVGYQREQLIAFMEYVQTKRAIYFLNKEELADEYLKSN